MYKILIVEDEPPTMRYLKQLIQTKCKGFTIIATAENGVEALEIINSSIEVDVVLTDIKMPIMDGIELVTRIRSYNPSIYSAIISGYQDFEYAKESFKAGVTDYLLKPIKLDQLNKLLNSLVLKLDDFYYKAGINLIKDSINGIHVEEENRSKYIKCQRFYAIIIRKNTLPTRFSSRTNLNVDSAIFTGLDAKILKTSINVTGVWFLGCMEESETVVILGDDNINCSIVKKASEMIASKLSGTEDFYNIVYSSNYFELNDMNKSIEKMYHRLDQLIVIGKSQVFADTALPLNKDVLSKISSTFENKIEFFISSRSMNNLKQEITKLFAIWQKEDYPQIWIEKIVVNILNIVEKHSFITLKDSYLGVEDQLNDVLVCLKSLEQLHEFLWNIIDEMLVVSVQESYKNKKDAVSILEKIDLYIQKNFAESISLQSVCDNLEVSQTYVSRLFRKYKNISFNEYITVLRINEARRLMGENPDMLLKDVALIIGYKDPFYFSRVFKTVTGCAPSEYCR